MMKTTKTISGVSPVAVMTSPAGCPGHCIYCPSFPSIPKSYTAESPVVLRARVYGYNGKVQTEARIETLQAIGHPTDKVELIIMGGTFLASPIDYQYDFIKDCFAGLNGRDAQSLEEAKKLNEWARNRCVGLCIETRPDFCGEEEIKRMLEFGTTRVELGVQTLDEEVLKLVRRGHGIEEVKRATRALKDCGFKVYYHWMPGLPGMSWENEIKQFKRLFTEEGFRPDGVKIYPTLVIEGTELERWYHEGKYKPYDREEMVELISQIKSLVPKYVRIPRVMRDIPAKFILAGVNDLNLREVVKRRMREKGIECQCIRCREYGHRLRDGWRIGTPLLKRLDYDASEGKEIFLSFEDERETLFALLRLRIPSSFDSSVFIRELHTFGPEVPLSEKNVVGVQHRGLGQALLKEGERIAMEEIGAKRMAILSGVGAKEYYRKFSYHDKGHYMVKEL
jgi:elongator complex protein 3